MVETHRLAFRPRALTDLENIEDYIADRSGPAVAAGYVDRIEAACRELTTFPLRGTARDDIRPGLRTVGFERRATIVFLVAGDTVRIVRVLYGGVDLEPALEDEG